MKIPKIVTLVDVEMIRDGGSYWAYVVDENGTEYSLRLKIILRKIFAEKWRLASFEAPILYKEGDDFATDIKWEYCQNILALPHTIENPIHLKWLSEMKTVARKSGKAPWGMKISGPWISLSERMKKNDKKSKSRHHNTKKNP